MQGLATHEQGVSMCGRKAKNHELCLYPLCLVKLHVFPVFTREKGVTDFSYIFFSISPTSFPDQSSISGFRDIRELYRIERFVWQQTIILFSSLNSSAIVGRKKKPLMTGIVDDRCGRKEKRKKSKRKSMMLNPSCLCVPHPTNVTLAAFDLIES